MTPDGTRFASACTDGHVRIWDSQTLEPVMELKSDATDLAYSLDGSLLATVSPEGTLLRRTDTWEVQRLIPGLGRPLAFASDGHHLFGVEGGRWVRWDLDGRDRTVPAPPLANAPPELAAAVGRDRLVVAAYGDKRRLRVLSAATGEGSVTLGGMDSVKSVAGSADGRWVAAGNWHGTVAVWNADTGERVAQREALRRGAEALSFSPDGTQLFCGGRDQLIRILRFDPEQDEPLQQVGTLRGHSHEVVELRFLAGGARLVSGSSDASVRVWNLAGRQEEWGPRIPGLGSLIFDFNADATEFHSLEQDGFVSHWGGSPPRELSRQLLPLQPYAAPLAVGDGSVFLGDRNGGLARWDLKRKNSLWSLRRGSAPLVPMAYSPSSGLLAVAEYGGRGRLHLFRPPASEPEHTFEDFRGEFYEYTRKAAISPDARWLAYPGPNQTVKLVDLKSRTLRFTLTGMSSDVTALAFSKDGDRLAATGGDGTLIVWSLDSGTPVLGPFLAHAAAVTHVEFSDDGKTVLTTASAGGLRLWNAANGRSMISIPEAESTPAPLLAEGDRALVFWNLKTGDLERHPAPPLPSMTPSKR